MFGKKGQGSLEYLLLIGGAVLVAAIVIALVVSSGTQSAVVSKCNTAKALCTQKFPAQALCNGVAAGTGASVSIQGTKFSCQWSTTQVLCIPYICDAAGINCNAAC